MRIQPFFVWAWLLLAVLGGLAGCQGASQTAWDEMPAAGVLSPDGQLALTLALINGVPHYQLERNQTLVVLPSRLGFEFTNAPPLGDNMAIIQVETASFDETWEQPWGEERFIRNRYNELRVTLEEAGDLQRQMVLVFRLFNDGLGFRYELPAQPNLQDIQIRAERTEFALAEDADTWSIPALQENRYEYLISQVRLRELKRPVHTPLTLRNQSGLFLSIHEAALVDYASMYLEGNANGNPQTLQARLVPWRNGVAVVSQLPLKTPWRTIQVAEWEGDLITSYLVLNLNEPNQLGDVSWVKPGKYVGIWWGMHLGIYTWGSGPNHGATTARTKEYIDFAALYGFRGVLVEGWNLGWDGNWAGNGASFSFTQPYPDFDLEEVTRYAREKGVVLIGHHETAANTQNYESQMEDAFALYQRLGVDTVKTGYVGSRLDGGEWHHGQFGVAHYNHVMETAARYQISINIHEPIKDTGLRRTYPNMLSREGARGAEYDAWSGDGGNPPNHVLLLAFQRMLSGPMDYTPGMLDVRYPEHQSRNQINTTVAKQLAFYVVLYSPLQMAADLPENYVNNPAFQFIVDVPCDWETTRVLHASIGESLTIVRKDRNSDDWYLGSVTAEDAQNLTARLDFLDPGVTYLAQIYADGPDAHWNTNPWPVVITEQQVTSADRLELALAPGGGMAIRFSPIK